MTRGRRGRYLSRVTRLVSPSRRPHRRKDGELCEVARLGRRFWPAGCGRMWGRPNRVRAGPVLGKSLRSTQDFPPPGWTRGSRVVDLQLRIAYTYPVCSGRTRYSTQGAGGPRGWLNLGVIT